MKEHTYPDPNYPANPNLSSKQFHILNTLKEGDIVSFKGQGNKTFGKKHTVLSVDRSEQHVVHVHSLPLNDTRKTTDSRYVTNEQSYATPNLKGMIYKHSFAPNNPDGWAPYEIRKH